MEQFKNIFLIFSDEDFKAVNKRLLINDKIRKLSLDLDFKEIVKKSAEDLHKAFMDIWSKNLYLKKISDEINNNEDFKAIMAKYEVEKNEQHSFFAGALLGSCLIQNMTEEILRDDISWDSSWRRDERSWDDCLRDTWRRQDDRLWDDSSRDTWGRDDRLWEDTFY